MMLFINYYVKDNIIINHILYLNYVYNDIYYNIYIHLIFKNPKIKNMYYIYFIF